MKKSDLKNGMIVELRNGKRFMVIGENLLSRNAHYPMELLTDDLFNKAKMKSKDIIKVYELIGKGITNIFDWPINELKLIWQRMKIDWSKVPVDTKVLVSIDGENWHKRHFAKYENNKIYIFQNGETSWTQKNNCNVWDYVKIAEALVTYGEIYEKNVEYCENRLCEEECKYSKDFCLVEYILDNYNVTRK